jgi:hypothetical protein
VFVTIGFNRYFPNPRHFLARSWEPPSAQVHFVDGTGAFDCCSGAAGSAPLFAVPLRGCDCSVIGSTNSKTTAVSTAQVQFAVPSQCGSSSSGSSTREGSDCRSLGSPQQGHRSKLQRQRRRR